MANSRRWVVAAGDFATAKAAGPAVPANIVGTDRRGCATPADYWPPSAGHGVEHAQRLEPRPISRCKPFSTGTATRSDRPCYAADDLKLQQISLQVVSPDGRATEKLDVVKDG